MNEPRPGPKPGQWLTSAECAARTGLTVRALRVYERYRLVAPKRTPNGWRGYGVDELQRLNTISVLKTIGLTLRQIRTLLDKSAPPLQQVLELQLEACRKRREDAERAESIARLALLRLEQRQHSLSVDELCTLMRGLEMSKIPLKVQELLDRHMTAAEQEQWRGALPQQQPVHEDMKAYAAAQRAEIFLPLQQLMESGSDAAAPEVQRLVENNNELMTKHAVRSHLLATWQANPAVFAKALKIGRAAMDEAKAKPEVWHASATAPGVLSFFFKAVMASAHFKVTDGLLLEIGALIDAGEVDSGEESQMNSPSPGLQSIADRFRAACERYHLGDPLVYAQWAPTQRAGLDSQPGIDRIAAWRALAQALQSRDAGSEGAGA